ncbi:DUF3696 domain-containing protein [Pseudomonas sp. LRF_L74]|uniref:DUF3696 domain-containing protein n=1 Tax=Pseudomonas sp. LRF_L74 TaxID=3369422 RepID=UPI003F62B9D2
MNINSIKIENFKKFTELEMDLRAPITLVYGENSSGKTSMLRAILGLAQTFSQNNKFQSWNAQGEFVDLGLYKDYIKDHNTKNKFSISIRSSEYKTYHMSNKKGAPPKHETEHKFIYEFDTLTSQAKLNSFVESTRSIDGQSISSLISNPVFPLLNPEALSVTSIKIAKPKTRSYYQFTADPNAVAWWFGNGIPNEMKKFVEDLSIPTKVTFDHRFSVETDLERTHGYNSKRMKNDLFQRAIRQTESILAKVHYLGPLRMSPYRSYKLSAHTSYVGTNGETTPLALSYLYKKSLEDRTKTKIHKARYENFTKWFALIFPDYNISVEQNDDVVRLKTTTSGRIDSISDVGFGFSQVLPILVQAAAMEAGETLIIEQPELHLHPKAQVAFGKFLTDATKHGLRFIIETHSEHILKGLQLQISNGMTDKKNAIKPQEIKIYYFHKTKVTNMELNKWGEIEGGWPAGFFDESYHISKTILKNKIAEINSSNAIEP